MAKLKPKQLALIESLLAQPMKTDLEIAEELNINRNTVRKYKLDPDFKEEYQKRLEEKWKDSERMAIENMQKLARSGDFKALKYILDSLGYAPVEKTETLLEGNVTMSITIDEDE